MQAARKRNQKMLGQEIRVVWRQSLTSLLVWNIYYECEGERECILGRGIEAAAPTFAPGKTFKQ